MVSSKKISSKNFEYFELFQVWDHEIVQKWLSTYNKVKGSLELTETTQNVVRNVYLDYLIGFEKNNFFGKIWNFWTFLQVRGHEFFKNH